MIEGLRDSLAVEVQGRADVAGVAMTGGGDGPPDPLDPARAVRRALADARRKAVEVDRLVVSTSLCPTIESAMTFARQALGPHGELVECAIAPSEELLKEALERDHDGALIVAVFGEPTRTTAVCLRGLSRW